MIPNEFNHYFDSSANVQQENSLRFTTIYKSEPTRVYGHAIKAEDVQDDIAQEIGYDMLIVFEHTA